VVAASGKPPASSKHEAGRAGTAGNWKLEAGSWKLIWKLLEAGSWKLEADLEAAGSWQLEAGS
jgi:hypothetical protein